MDEAVKIYTPVDREAKEIIENNDRHEYGISFNYDSYFENTKKSDIRKFEKKLGIKHKHESLPWDKNSKWKLRVQRLKEVFQDRCNKERNLMAKYPAFNLFYNWTIAFLIVCLFGSFVKWGLDIRTDHIAEAFAATALADYQAEQEEIARVQQQAEEAERLEEKAVIGRMSTEAAKAVYGIRNFIEKYGYSTADIKTYVRCMCDRVDYFIKTQLTQEEQENLTLEQREMIFKAVVKQEGQFLAYSEKNPPLNEHYSPCFEEIQTWIHEETKPWDITYRFAELNDDGIWLVQNINSDGYARRVRY